ncbi:MAG: TRAP transporter small permease [Azoarcus sp.]|nr:TRAP transporter small permease [Azoarcus sp.]
MRRFLDTLYLLSGYLAAFFLMMIAVLVIAQVTARFFGVIFESTETGGFCLAASTFLGLAHTLKRGCHIRVSLFIHKARGSTRKAIELWSTSVAAVVMGYVTWAAAHMVYESWFYEELSPGMMAVPIWIPQLGMLLGCAIVTIAFVDEFCRIACGAEAAYQEQTETALSDDDPKSVEVAPQRADGIASHNRLERGRAS